MPAPLKKVLPGHAATWDHENGTILRAMDIQINSESDEIEHGDTENEGYDSVTDGMSRSRVTFKGMWNAAENPHDAPNIVNGAQLKELYIYLDAEQTLPYYFPFFKVLTVGVAIAVKDGIKLEFSGRNQGKFYYPGDIASQDAAPDDENTP